MDRKLRLRAHRGLRTEIGLTLRSVLLKKESSKKCQKAKLTHNSSVNNKTECVSDLGNFFSCLRVGKRALWSRTAELKMSHP